MHFDSFRLKRSYSRSKEMQQKAHRMIPGGAHTYAKGDDQYPVNAPGFIERGVGCHVWDVDGNEFIEYGMGLRAVTLGHAYRPVVEAVHSQLENGSNYTRPSRLEVEAAESLLSLVDAAEMVKFAKDGSTVTTAAIKVARAATGREKIAYCVDNPFLSYNDWFIGGTAMDRGVSSETKKMNVSFRYNDFASVEKMFSDHEGEIACVILEPARAIEPQDDFLHKLRDIAHRKGALFVVDEMITGFRWANGGGQEVYNLDPDLSAFGKGMANGFSQSALVGKSRYLNLGGINHDEERVFLLSSTHGAESHALSAMLATIEVYTSEPVVARLYEGGERLRSGILKHVDTLGLNDYFLLQGRPCNLVYATLDENRKPSQLFRTLFLQEIIERGILAPSFVNSYSHADQDYDDTAKAVGDALVIYKQALEQGVEKFLYGRPVQPVFRKFG